MPIRSARGAPFTPVTSRPALLAALAAALLTLSGAAGGAPSPAAPSPTPALAPPLKTGEPFRFVIFGDTRSRPAVHAGIVQAIVAEPDLRFAVHTGDLVGRGDVSRYWDQFFAIEAPLLARLPLYPAVGNHDVADGRADELLRRFALPETRGAERPYYAVDHGNVHVVVLDAYVNVEPPAWCRAHRRQRGGTCFDDAQLAWLEADLRAAAGNPATDHIVVVTHVGPYSSTRSRGGSPQLRALLPLFAETGVTLVASGHDHAYERGTTENGIAYVVSGGGGAPLYEVGFPSRHPNRRAVARSVEHYLVAAVEGQSLRLTAKTPQGEVIDEFTILAPEKDRRAAPPAAPPAVGPPPHAAPR